MNDAKTTDETKLMMLTGHWIQQMISVIARIGLPNHLGAEPREVSELASELDVNAESLFRICRALSKVGVLTVSGTRIGLTDTGRVLRDDAPDSVKHVACFAGSPGPWKAWGELIRTLEKPQSTVKIAHGVDFWSYLAAHPEEGSHFNRSMANITNAAVKAVIARYDFSYADVICDVGGGAGSVVAMLLESNPKQRGIVFDVPTVIEDARVFWKNNPVSDRCSFVAGNFLESVPKGADVYVLKNIVNNWDDTNARAILTNCRAAMSERAKIVLLESPLVDDGPTFSFLLDIHMMVLFGGRERTPAEYGALLASSGLELLRVVPTGGLLTVIEARRAARS
jgi:O-methyltransferase domain